MRYEKLGKSGLEVSVVTLGCMSFGEPGGRGRLWTLEEAACRDLVVESRRPAHAATMPRLTGPHAGKDQQAA